MYARAGVALPEVLQGLLVALGTKPQRVRRGPQSPARSHIAYGHSPATLAQASPLFTNPELVLVRGTRTCFSETWDTSLSSSHGRLSPFVQFATHASPTLDLKELRHPRTGPRNLASPHTT